VDFGGWNVSALSAAVSTLGRKAEDGTSHDEPPKPGSGEKKRADTLFIAGALFLQMQEYQRKLQRAFEKAVTGLAGVAEAGGSKAQADAVLLQMEKTWLTLAPTYINRAYNTGSDFAAGFLGGTQLTDEEAAKALAKLVNLNKGFVQDSFVPAVRLRYIELTAAPDMTVADAVTAVDGIADSFGARVGMYATRLWGAGHQGFADQMAAGEKLLEWVVTSGNPCNDCPDLEAGSPYGPDNPLPTFPGAGDTACRTNCLCLLREYGVPGKATPPATASDIEALKLQVATGYEEMIDVMERQHAHEALLLGALAGATRGST